MRDTSVTRRLANSGVEAIGYASLAGYVGRSFIALRGWCLMGAGDILAGPAGAACAC